MFFEGLSLGIIPTRRRNGRLFVVTSERWVGEKKKLLIIIVGVA
jgi:hypothetical protein